MANIKSAIKRIKKAQTAHDRNVSQKSKMKTIIKKVDATLTEDASQVSTALSNAYKAIDTVEQKGVIHPNKAARLKSRLTKKVNKAANAPASPVKEKKVVAKKTVSAKKTTATKTTAKKAPAKKKD